MMEDEQQLKRYIRILLLLVSLIVTLVLVIWIYHVLMQGTLSVKTAGSTDYVIITPIKNGQLDSAHYKRAQHTLSLRVNAGSYEISATNNSSRVSKVISVKSRQSLSFILTPTVAVSPEPVYGNSVSGVVADSSHILFIDNTANNALSSIDGGNNVSQLYAQARLYDAKWANTSLGLAHDSNNNLFLVSGGNVSQLKLPVSIPQNASFSYDITPGGQIYFSQGKDIYTGVGGNFKKIYSGRRLVVALAVHGDAVAFIESSGKNSQDPEGSLVIVSSSGRVRQTKVSGSSVLWSPSGKYIAVMDDSGLGVYVGVSLAQVASLPLSSSNSFAWDSQDNLFYNQNESLWELGLTTGESSELAVAAGKANIIGIYPAVGGSYVYLSTASTNPNASPGASQLFRVGLKHQPSPTAILGLSVFLPETVTIGGRSCSLNYINFTGPTIATSYRGTFSAASEGDCLNLTKAEIEQYGLSPGDYQYRVAPDNEE